MTILHSQPVRDLAQGDDRYLMRRKVVQNDRKKAIRVVLYFDDINHVDRVLDFVDFGIPFPSELHFLGYDYAEANDDLPTEGLMWE